MKKIILLVAFAITTCFANAQSSCSAYFTYSDSGLTVSFVDSSYGTTAPTNWSWNFGDGTSSTLQSPSHTFLQSGTYVVCLTTYKPFSSCQSTFCDSVVVSGTNGNCIANYSYYPDTSNSLMYNFYDVSSGNPTSWYWDFDDGANSSSQNPNHIFPQVGQYNVCLIISGTNCSDTICQLVIISNTGNCYASFTSYTDSSNANLIYFMGYSSPNPISWQWNFGDGSGANTMQNPVHLFTSPGTYNVCLTVNDSSGCTNTNCQSIFIANQNNCSAYFTYTHDSINPLTFNFTDTSSGNPTSWLWDFGDTTTSNIQNPSHTFASSGYYYVCLTISDSSGTCTNTYCEYVQASNCYASFTSVADSANFDSIYFTDNSTGNTTDWLWDFGDGTNSTLQNPNHTYTTDGWYYVCLTISDSVNSCSSSYCNYVYAGFQSSCYAYFYYTPDSANQLTVNFSGNSQGSAPANWSWDFGDSTTSSLQNPSHTFLSSGIYHVCLTISDSSGSCSNTYCDYVNVGNFSTCQADFSSAPGFFGNTMNFTDSSSGNPTNWFWDFGDSATSTQQNPFHNYGAAGTYYVCLTISDSTGNCFNTYCDSVSVGNQPPPCTAHFTYFVTGNVVSFADSSTGTVSNYFWNFGDGSTPGTQQNAIHAFTDSGYYNVCLTISDFATGCFNTYCDSVYIAPSPAGCQAGFTYVVIGDSVVFTNTSSGNPVAFSWNFGDFQSSNMPNPSHVYNTFGFGFTYTVCLTITAANGCYSTYCDSVVIVGIDEASVQNNFLIYPNPAKENLFIRNISADAGKFNLKIFNQLGELVEQHIMIGTSETINFSERAAGLYLITLQNEKAVIQKKVMVVK